MRTSIQTSLICGIFSPDSPLLILFSWPGVATKWLTYHLNRCRSPRAGYIALLCEPHSLSNVYRLIFLVVTFLVEHRRQANTPKNSLSRCSMSCSLALFYFYLCHSWALLPFPSFYLAQSVPVFLLSLPLNLAI